ncbi:MAG: molybdenum cofactor biosynthesis protein MoaE [Candidatus Delongbacteria bacterium]
MSAFSLSDTPLAPEALARDLCHDGAGALVVFEGRVRDENEGRAVLRLDYEAYEVLCLKEGGRILDEARTRFGLLGACGVHRTGSLELGECAIWVGALAAHRGAAFDACRWIIDELKQRLPIWKREHYRDGTTGWVRCEACAAPGAHGHAHPTDGERHA